MSTKPISDRKLAANRANAKKSTGPRTPEGKARACLNAVKHGLLAENVVLMNDPAETREELEAIRARLRDELAPAGVIEELLIERLAASYWRLRRAYRFEVQSIQNLRDGDNSPLMQLGRQMAGIEKPRRPAQLPDVNRLDMLLRYEGLIDRTLHRLTLQLARVRNAGASAEASAASPHPPQQPSEPAGPIPPQPEDPTKNAPDQTNPPDERRPAPATSDGDRT